MERGRTIKERRDIEEKLTKPRGELRWLGWRL